MSFLCPNLNFSVALCLCDSVAGLPQLLPQRPGATPRPHDQDGVPIARPDTPTDGGVLRWRPAQPVQGEEAGRLSIRDGIGRTPVAICSGWVENYGTDCGVLYVNGGNWHELVTNPVALRHASDIICE